MGNSTGSCFTFTGFGGKFLVNLMNVFQKFISTHSHPNVYVNTKTKRVRSSVRITHFHI